MTETIVFAGPSLQTADLEKHNSISFRPPVRQGDCLRAMTLRPRAIGIIDGYFGDRLAVHQKEILECMWSGIPVLGAASMGALRAAELSTFGMVGVGKIYDAYQSGKICADAEVAVAHGPEDLGSIAASIALVDVRATLDAIVRRRRLSRTSANTLLECAAEIHFLERSWSKIVSKYGQFGTKADALMRLLKRSHIQQKRLDALELINMICSNMFEAPKNPFAPPMTTAYQNIKDRAFQE